MTFSSVIDDNHTYRHLQRLGLNHDRSSSSSPYQPGAAVLPGQNGTYSDDGQEVREYNGGVTAVVSVIIFLILIGSLLCIQVGRLRKSSPTPTNSASDGNTVASLEDLEDDDDDDDKNYMKDIEQGTNDTMTEASDNNSASSLETEKMEKT